ncbi:CaiB/BaiF CoA transferase family protein [Pedomonas mirosovicensis]|uniref:CaiB/BaiF CoA transferase family protein n=1 Tax=Pedomonas mirosovicensis TaxID=2908641 RepID=UPI00216A2101|nr:CaiB/BaiF CoA-transferase family protein [Pedomonas mirosovicensis]MCH8685441.1 CoA transferase [Pedomonas mirosovicensis]
MAGALAGIRVLDLSRVLAGPWAGQILADLGADVIKVERPKAGDDTRGWGPPFLKDQEGNPTRESAYYLCANRGKRSLALDITHPKGQEIIRKLAAESDVLLENFKTGGLAKYGLDYETLRKINPRLIYCSITGFGQNGPNANRPGYDFLIQGMAGLMSITGTPESGPTKVGVAVTDLTTGLYSVVAILAALQARHRTGEGQHIDMALFDVQLGWLANQATNYLVGGVVPGLMGNAHPNIVPYQDLPTKDGRIIVAVGNDEQFRRFARILGKPEWAQDERYATNRARVAHRAELVALIEAELKREDAGHWLAALDAAGIPCGRVASVAEAFESEQAKARGLTVALDHPLSGTVRTAANPIKLSGTPIEYGNAPPTVGQHSRKVLSELGLSADDIRALAEAGVVDGVAE